MEKEMKSNGHFPYYFQLVGNVSLFGLVGIGADEIALEGIVSDVYTYIVWPIATITQEL